MRKKETPHRAADTKEKDGLPSADNVQTEKAEFARGAALERIVVVEEFGSHGRTSSRTTRRLNTRSSQPDRMLTHSTAKQTLRSYVP